MRRARSWLFGASLFSVLSVHAQEPPPLAPVETAPPETAPLSEPPPLAPISPTQDDSDKPPSAEPVPVEAAPETKPTPTATPVKEAEKAKPVAKASPKMEIKAEPAPLPTAEVAAPVPAPTPSATETPPPMEVAEPRTEPVPEPATQPTFAPTVSRRRNPRVPLYQTLRPSWGVEISGSVKALGGADLGQGSTTSAFNIQFEWQPKFLQAVGVFGFGPQIGIYPNSTVAANAWNIWQVGGQARYQLRLFREQPIVPMAGYEYQYINYKLTDGPSGHGSGSGPILGVWLLLNFLDPGGAAEFYVNDGVTRSYAVVEYRSLVVNAPDFSTSGQSLYFGLRLEF